MAGILRTGHTCTQRPRLQATATRASTETHPQGFTQAHDTSVLWVALDIQMEQSHYCTHGLHM